jgi:D-allose transport system substrate-binding protein
LLTFGQLRYNCTAFAVLKKEQCRLKAGFDYKSPLTRTKKGVKMKKLIAVVAIVLIVAGLGFAAGGKQAGEERYAFLLKPFSNEYWATMKDGVEKWAKENNVIVDIYGAESEENLPGQLNQLEDLARKDYAGIGVAPLSPVNLINGIISVNKKNIPIIDIDEQVDFKQLQAAGGNLIGNYTTDNIAVGKKGGEFIVKTIGSGKAAIIQGTGGNVTSQQRSKGAEDALKAAGITVVAIQPGDWDRVKSLDVATNIIQANPDIKAFYCANDTMALGVLQAVQNANKASQIIVVGTDAVPGAVQSVKDGGLAATVGQDPVGIGIACLKDLIAAHRGGYKFDAKAEVPVKFIDSFLVTK